MKLFILLFVAFFNINSCVTQKVNKEIKNYIEKVTYQNWVGGVKGAGSGIFVQIYLLKNLPSNTEFVKIQFQDSEALLLKKSELQYQANLTKNNNSEETEKASTIKIGLKTNEAKLFFKIDGKENTVVLENIKKLPMLMYPSAKPKN